MGVNKFTDYSEAEYKMMLGFKSIQGGETKEVHLKAATNPTSVDWRTKGAVTPVKNQGQCGSCWAFSTTGSLEGANFIKTGVLDSLSEQNLVDCSKLNHGCNGGSMVLAMNYSKTHPLDSEASYPYTGVDGTCDYNQANGEVAAKTAVSVPSKNAPQLETAVAQQPVSIAIEADQSVFQSYTSGVLDSAACGTNLDHGVLIVGYGTDATAGPYWIVKNSWGADWGMDGYVNIAKDTKAGTAGICGINMQPAYPTM